MHVNLRQIYDGIATGMSTTIIARALKGLVRTGRVIIARYREDCPRSERPRIDIVHPGMSVLLAADKASDILLMECSNAFHLTAMLLNLFVAPQLRKWVSADFPETLLTTQYPVDGYCSTKARSIRGGGPGHPKDNAVWCPLTKGSQSRMQNINRIRNVTN